MINELKMDELKNLFFYTFGIVPLQNYNVIGDGITDNRLNIQQAIYDAIEVGARYIFVPKGEYFYTAQLFKANEVVFIGNSVDSKIKDIEIEKFPEFTPIGGIIISAALNIPANYLECNGQTVNSVDYPFLYKALKGETENPDSTFDLPTLASPGSGMKYIIRAK